MQAFQVPVEARVGHQGSHEARGSEVPQLPDDEVNVAQEKPERQDDDQGREMEELSRRIDEDQGGNDKEELDLMPHPAHEEEKGEAADQGEGGDDQQLQAEIQDRRSARYVVG